MSSDTNPADGGSPSMAPAQLPVLAGGTGIISAPVITALLQTEKVSSHQLGVSRKYFDRMAMEYCATEEEVADLIHLRVTHRASLPKVRSLMDSGLSVVEIGNLYEVHEELRDGAEDDEWVPSLVLLHRATKAFSHLGLDQGADGLAEAIREMIDEVVGGREVTMSLALKILCEYAEAYPGHSVDAVIEMIKAERKVPRS